MTLSREQMEKIITEEKRSVLYQGRVISRVEDLPGEAELAGDDPKALEAARAKLEAEAEKIQQQLAALQRGQNTFAGEAENDPAVPTAPPVLGSAGMTSQPTPATEPKPAIEQTKTPRK